ncbi:MAG: DNA polymerase IV [Acidimicrobiales bacterium]
MTTTGTPSPPGILHMDMDAFFVAVEVHRDPSLAGRPVVVGGTGNRGVVAAASYEARAYGIHSAMPTGRARRLCPHAVFLPGHHERYGEVSARVMAILASFTPLVEPLSLDEAFLDVTGSRRLWGTGPEIAVKIRDAVLAQEGLTCSVGVAPTKFLAKLASEAAKPVAALDGVRPGRGVVVVPVGGELAFLHPLPVRALWGVGPKTHERLDRLGVATVGDLAALPLATLVATVGDASGRHLHALANGVDDRAVVPDQGVKSVGHEETFATDHHDPAALARELARLADAVGRRLRAHGLAGRTVVLKVRFGDFSTITRSTTLPDVTDSSRVITRSAQALLAAIDVSVGVRLIGVSVGGLSDGGAEQLALGDPADWPEADRTMDRIRDRFGADAIAPAVTLRDEGIQAKRRGDQQWGPGD